MEDMNKMKKIGVFSLIIVAVISSFFVIKSVFIVDKIDGNNNNNYIIEENEEKEKNSKLYIPGVSVDDVILYFNEVSLAAEFSNSGDPSKVQKWNEPIYYIINGKYTKEDYTTLTNFTKWLNTIEGFPGIYETKDANKANLNMHFVNQDKLLSIMGSEFYGLDGAVTFWYSNNIIYDAVICYRTDIEQNVRNSVILEEIYNGLGPVQDTSIRQDSIIYSEFSTPQELTDIDELILKLLYSKEIKNGMNAKECEEAIRKLYY